MENKTLLLDKNYLAIAIISMKKATKLLMRAKVESVGTQAFFVQAGNGKFRIPTILRLTNSIPYRIVNQIRFSRKNVMVRDNFTCQYCFEKLGKYSGTIDHVIPKSRGGTSEYINCVAACNKCNNMKADRTPEEAGMPLNKVPKKPTFVSLNRNYLSVAPDEWKDYLIGF